MANKLLFIEGAPESEANGNLRQGFEKLLKKKLGNNTPRIVMGHGKSKAVDKYLRNSFTQHPYLLIDLDHSEEQRLPDLREYKLEGHSQDVFFMVQEMESWFISQPDVLDEYYGTEHKGRKVSEKIPRKPAADFANPKEELKKFTKDSKRKTYNEIKHAIDLLAMLDPIKLEADFQDFKNLILALT